MQNINPRVVTGQAQIRPQTAALDNPLYYLENARTVINWVMAYHGDLLTDSEMARLEQLLALPQPSQALLMRLVMRSSDLFRLRGLNYPELGQPVAEALAPLVSDHWIDPDPKLTFEELCYLLRRSELAAAFAQALNNAGLKTNATKAVIEEALHTHLCGDERTLAGWWQGCDDQAIRLCDEPLFERIRLMFFGNLRQSWSEFVITELGHQRYEPVPLSPESRAFNRRGDVDQYLAIHACRQRLDDAVTAEDCQVLRSRLPEDTGSNPWLSHRRARLLFDLGQKLERAGELVLARDSYREAWTPDARVRYFRLLEKMAPATEVWPLIERAETEAETDSERQRLGRIRQRVAKKAGIRARPKPPVNSLTVQTLELPSAPAVSVEQQVALTLADQGGHCFYVENTLFNSLFGLLFWPTIFAPLPGAFFHPFQAGPADLYREDFVGRRREQIEDSLLTLEQGDYRQRILQHWQTRHGVANPFVHWPA
ncbi:MAG: nuclease, partial [Porticoccaceae bacterium]|nr:nuclease [Porticoccaceae bacterium]